MLTAASLSSSSGAHPARWRPYLPAVVVAFSGFALSILICLTIRQWEQRDLRLALQSLAQQRIELLRETLSNSLESLQSLRSLYGTGVPVDRERFRRFVSDALSRRPELQAMSWTPRVPADERALYEAKARAEGFPEFQFLQYGPDWRRIAPAAPAPDFYYPVYYIEPLARNRAALGFDLNARRETLERACDRGAAATPLVRLIQEEHNDPGFVVYLPLYAGATPPTPEARRQHHTGFVAAVFRIGNLVQPALARLAGVRVSLQDATDGDSGVVYSPPAADAGAEIPRIAPYAVLLPVVDRQWRITFTPTTRFVAAHQSQQHWAALGVGGLATLLLVAYMVADLHRRIAIARANAALHAEITERQRAEQAAASANRAKSDFLANLSHEIRTPLNSILGYTQILERDPQLPTRHRDAVDALANSGLHLLGLLNSILDLSKIEAGRMELQRDAFDLPTLVRGLAAMFQPRCAEKRLALRVDCRTKGAHPVVGDEGKLRQVLINLIGNALKFTPRGEVFIGVRSTGHEQWLFEVIDTGIGLSNDECAGLFTPFHQTAAGRRSGGTGLGLAIARRQVELLGGQLEVQSEPGFGARFFFTVPLPVAAAAPAGRSASALPRLLPGVAVRALVVDDNRDNRVILRRLLADIGCGVAEAADIQSARDIARQAPPDILFIDVLLADATGPDVLAAIREDGLPVSTPVLFHTAALLDRPQRDALRATGADLLAKPFRVEDLCSCLRRLPGVLFAEAVAPVTVTDAPPPDLDVLVIPEHLCARMTVAAELHSTTVLKACLDELRQLGGGAEAFADHLRQLLRAYDMHAISLLLSRVRVQPKETAPR